MEIRELDRATWAGYVYRETYTTDRFYDVQVQERGFSLELREADPPLERVMSDRLFADWLEAPVAYGAFDGYEDCVARCTKVAFLVQPNEKNHAVYKKGFQTYRAIHDALAPVYHALCK